MKQFVTKGKRNLLKNTLPEVITSLLFFLFLKKKSIVIEMFFDGFAPQKLKK